TRFAPSPTGFLHLGSIRTALYNWLLARHSHGTFILRIDDTDRTRIVPGAVDDILDQLKWLNLDIDNVFVQSERTHIYRQAAESLLQSGHAYRCSCPPDRLSGLRDSAAKMVPPSSSSYDRHCLVNPPDPNRPHVVRLKSPDTYPLVYDLLRGDRGKRPLKIQPQGHADPRTGRYDDPVLLKSDGQPTYHLASVVDDHEMNISHVLRGEEWLPSTSRHVYLAEALGFQKPHYIHLPLLAQGGGKLSKRNADISVRSYREHGYLPEALANFIALFGWSPHTFHQDESVSDKLSLAEMAERFSIDNLTLGTAQVNEDKLQYLNRLYLTERLADDTRRKELIPE
ncbi:hypothetical protein CANCADRAFT_18760, partial [Tortispora caseinolytica NRRL Y-17796]